MCPYLKDVHHALDSWRSGRDSNGLMLIRDELTEVMTSEEEIDNFCEEEGAPVGGRLTSRLKDDLEALKFLLEGSTSKRVPVQLESTDFVNYEIEGDFCTSYEAAIHVKGKIHFKYGELSTKGGGVVKLS